MGKTILEQSKTTTKGEILFTMTTLPEPTLQDLKDYETFHQSLKYIVKYRETLMTEEEEIRMELIDLNLTMEEISHSLKDIVGVLKNGRA
jgi:hypothetical protein